MKTEVSEYLWDPLTVSVLIILNLVGRKPMLVNRCAFFTLSSSMASKVLLTLNPKPWHLVATLFLSIHTFLQERTSGLREMSNDKPRKRELKRVRKQ
jgi:hypothetical protein